MSHLFPYLLALGLAMVGFAAEPAFIVEDGEAKAEIVMPENPPDSVQYAALELQTYIEKMTGARLPIIPDIALAKDESAHLLTRYPPETPSLPIRIYVGQSWHTDQLGITTEGLKWGGYRVKSGKDWLVLMGRDSDFIPQGIWGRTRNDWLQRGQQEWEEAIGDYHWINPIGGRMFNEYNPLTRLWSHDEKGSVNAVCGFLRELGVRWYMPGELGEIVPKMASIALPEVDKTVNPAFFLRKFSFNKYGLHRAQPEVFWSLRLGANEPFGFNLYHGQREVTRPAETRRQHPDYLALYNGKRDVVEKTGNPCLSSEGLFQENLAYARLMFDMYNLPAISVWPDDGFTLICECEKCEGKDDPERGRQGVLSNYVWGFTERLARELYKTHPDRLIIGGAYSTYYLPPDNIEGFSPNVAVHIVNARRRYHRGDEHEREKRQVVRQWAGLTGGKVIAFMNYGGAANTPHLFAEDIKAYQDLIIGEDMWGPYERGTLATIGFTHLNYYVCARLWWDPDTDIDALLDEYYQNFYGPAAKQMEAFIDFYEVEQKNMASINSAETIKQALDLFDAALAQVEPDSVYGQRLALFSEGLKAKRKFYAQIKDGRENPPVFDVQPVSGDITIDGELSEPLWQELPGTLVHLESGEAMEYPAHFQIGLQDNNLYVGIKCMDQPGNPVNIAPTDGQDDSALWNGDAVEILLETPALSYYQIAINPAGVVTDLDRSEPLVSAFNWNAEATVATQINEEEGTWTVEVRIPFTPSTQDPLHEIIGSAPSAEQPWFFNIARQRVRDAGTEKSAFSPTGHPRSFHKILKFGKLTVQ